MLGGKVHVIAVEVKGASGTGAAEGSHPGERDAVTVDRVHHQVILGNDHVRVFEAVASPGAKSPMHTHPPITIISLAKARVRMTLGDGSSTIFDLNPGQALWIPDAEHSWEMLAGDFHVIAVEPKAAWPASGE